MNDSTGSNLFRSEVREGMRIDWDVPLEMDDGNVLRANVYRPDAPGRYPVILSHGPYGKDLAWQDGYSSTWKLFSEAHPEALAASSNIHQSWETVDPELWVADGYVCIRVDSRGAGRSPGLLELRDRREIADFAACIEWAAAQPWSNGKVGLNGISYYAIAQWFVAALAPKGLAAMCAWEGSNDYYRESTHQGGILCTFATNWYDRQVKSVQHGYGTRGRKSRVHGEWVGGPETLSDEELARNRVDLGREVRTRPLIDDWYRERIADMSKVRTPFLSAANWGGQGLHPRGNFNAFMHAATPDKWLEAHGLEHWTEFYTPYGVELQKRFFGHFLKGEDTGWDRQPRVQLKVRHADETFVVRGEDEWPLARTQWTKVFLDPAHMALGAAPPAAAASHAYDGFGDGATFLLPPWEREVELTGPMAAKLFVSSATEDADLFLVVRLFAPDLREVTFKGTIDPHTPLAQGWLRASHRKLDPARSTPWQPWHTHDEVWKLTPGQIYELDIEIWPTCIVVPPGWRIGLTVRGKDYVWPGAETGGPTLNNFAKPLTGCGPFLHDDPEDRPEAVFGGKVMLHAGPRHPSHLLLPVVPPKG